MIHQLLQGDGRHILGIGGGGKPQLVGCHRQSLWPKPFVHNHPRGFITIAEALDGWEGQREEIYLFPQLISRAGEKRRLIFDWN